MDIKIKKVEFVKSKEDPGMRIPVVTIEQPSLADMIICAQEVFGVRDEYR